MAISDDLRKTLSDPTPLYFAAGTADLAIQQARKVPGLVEQLRTEAPARIDAVRNTDPKAVQERASARAKEAGVRVKVTQETIQTRVGEFLTSLDSDIKKFGTTLDADLKKLGETAQDIALRGVGVAAEYAVRARETYEKVAEHGEQAVRTWRGEAAEEIEDLAVAVEGKAEPVEVRDEQKPSENKAEAADDRKTATASASAPKKTAPVRKPVAKKTTPPPAK
ncbi:hypothetical protein ACIHAA_09630 [Streptomyces sp. NPDC052040]|uniref:hypothetical protein n=1 Tax=unclassified Streptomyces TaxID=2593676 RepID=UPI0037D45207